MSMTDGFKIGYALAQKKQLSFVRPSLVAYARSRGINLLPIDPTRPLVDQGRFDAILHKVRGEDWNKQLAEYEQSYPDVVIVDRPEAIRRLHNRVSMLQAVSELQVSEEQATFGVPKQCVVDCVDAFLNVPEIAALKFPVVAKPLVVDGTAKSHAMFLVFNKDSLKKLKPPVVVQEFVNHGGVVFKVYVVGDYVKCVRRKSLPDVQEDELRSTEEPMSFCHISNIASSLGQSSEAVDKNLSTVELPPSKFISEIAQGLRAALGLRLFNFDVIRDIELGNHYHVIDINYFPGYSKMPEYEFALTEFFLGLARENTAASTKLVLHSRKFLSFPVIRGREERSWVDYMPRKELGGEASALA